jgi:hypothetical protein
MVVENKALSFIFHSEEGGSRSECIHLSGSTCEQQPTEQDKGTWGSHTRPSAQFIQTGDRDMRWHVQNA